MRISWSILVPLVALAAVGFVRIQDAIAQTTGAVAEQPAQLAADLDEAPVFDSETQKAWLIRTSRMEGAAVNVREAADSLSQTATRIEQGGRLTAMSELMGDLNELNRRVVSARLAAEVLDE